MVETSYRQGETRQRRGRRAHGGPGAREESGPRHDGERPAQGDDVQDREDDWETERGDPTFGLDPVPDGSGHVEVPPADEDAPVAYGEGPRQGKATYTPDDEPDGSQAV